MAIKRLACVSVVCVGAGLLLAPISARAVVLCATRDLVDLSRTEVGPFGSEVLGITAAEGRVTNTRVELSFRADPPFDARYLAFTLIWPVLQVDGVLSLVLTGADLGWSGAGTFTTVFDTDTFDGAMQLDGAPWRGWSAFVSLTDFSRGPIRGELLRWSYDFSFASCRRGDLNCDDRVDFDDISAFTLALISRPAHEAAYPACDADLADMNGDFRVNFDDIDGFVACLAGGTCPPIAPL